MLHCEGFFVREVAGIYSEDHRKLHLAPSAGLVGLISFMPPPRGSVQTDKGGSGSGVFGALRAPATIQFVNAQGVARQGQPLLL